MRQVAAVALLAVGLVSTLVGGGALVTAWQAERAWLASGDRERAERQAEAETPLWVEPADLPVPAPVATAVDTTVVVAAPTPRPPAPTLVPRPRETPVADQDLAVPQIPVGGSPVRHASSSEIQLEASDFRFVDPPEPGARARLTLELASESDFISGNVVVRIPNKWFETYAPVEARPDVTDDRTDADGFRAFEFPPLTPGATQKLELEVEAIAEGMDPPEVVVQLDDGGVVGRAKPRTVAPKPRPGPVSQISIVNAGIKASVTQTTWEPPAFVIGQIKGSAHVTLGNTTLIGHLRGPGGDVFSRLDRVKEGDEVVAISRGIEYRFIASDISVKPNTDTGPLGPTDSPRLTMMTCTGTWNPFTDDYSHRLWVVAEPAELAKETIAANQERRAREAEEARVKKAEEEAARIQAAREAFEGEASGAGGLGNTRADFERNFGAQAGETFSRLAIYSKNGHTYRVAYTPKPERSLLVVHVLPENERLSFEAAVLEARKQFPKDAEPRVAAPEGNPQYVVERFASPSLAGANGAADGDFQVVYEKDPEGRIARIIIGTEPDIDALRARGAT